MTDLSSIRWATAPGVDFSPLGDLLKTYRDARREGARDRTLAQIDPNQPQNLANIGARLLQAGDVKGALAVNNLSNNQRDYQFRVSQADRTQANADRAFRLQEKQATEKPQYMKDGDGNIIEIAPYGGGAKVLAPTGGTGPINPYAPGGKQTEGEANAALYARRMFNSEPILRENEKAGTDLAQYSIANAPLVPRVVRNKMHSESYQKYDQAKRDFINATLRRESGAVISDPEFDNANKQYFPQPGDSQEVLKQKQRNRQEAMIGIAGAAGRNFRPAYTFGPNGEIVNPAQGGAAKQPTPQRAQPTPQRASDGKLYLPDPQRPGKFLMVVE